MLSSRPKKRQYWYGHTEDATFQGSICLANTLSICETKITQTYEDDKMGLSTGVNTFTRGGGWKPAFASYPARYYLVSLNGQSLLLFLSPCCCRACSLLSPCLVASNPSSRLGCLLLLADMLSLPVPKQSHLCALKWHPLLWVLEVSVIINW